MARPKKAPGDEAVPLTIPRSAFDLIDGHVRQRASAALFTMGETTGPTARELAAARSAFLAKLVDDALGFEARHPVRVTVSAPVHGGAPEMEDAAAWAKQAEEELLRSAPAPVQAAIKANREMHAARAKAEAGE